ncbi:MAG: hypothetical protein JRI58_11325 [Deltaproteobacteria bacterium]|nr:hypothetical protein [Deltaproteobacteria bacterium]MBW2075314.1 hypothetical protein [Deltaproteobacteria bacterium]RLB80638.1 MAG: hypothetical protein DRH17_11415 [Deltaproteobacteria bacterium]
MAHVAIPVFRSRIAPVFDSCLRVLLIHIENDHEIKRTELRFDNLSSSERIAALQRAGVTTLICGGISEVLHTMLQSSGVCTITGIAGHVEEVLAAFLANRLDEPQFYMPGRRASRERPLPDPRGSLK